MKQKQASAPAKNNTVKEICTNCGYSALHKIKGNTCPMCKPCPRCRRKLMQCECIEGE